MIGYPGIRVLFRKENLSCCGVIPYINPLLTKREVRMVGYWPRSSVMLYADDTASNIDQLDNVTY